MSDLFLDENTGDASWRWVKPLDESFVVVCGIVRDAERGLKANIPVVQSLCDCCKDWRVVVFENDSKDRTKELLAEWHGRAGERVHAICTDTDGSRTIPHAKDVKANRFFSRQRIEKMNRLRNQYLEYVEKQGWNPDYLVVVDLDVAQLNLGGILSTFAHDREWDAVTSFGYSTSPRLRRRYHDTYALTLWEDRNKPQTEEMTVRLADTLGQVCSTDDWIRVASAFGGLAIYKYASIKGLRYEVVSNDDPRVEVRSEHVGLYKQMMAHGYDKFYINPTMQLHYQRVTWKIVWNTLKRLVSG